MSRVNEVIDKLGKFANKFNSLRYIMAIKAAFQMCIRDRYNGN